MPSPRDVPTYDYKPQMSAREAADAFVGAWREDAPRFGIINFANPDMVGHTGVIPAAVDGDRDGRRVPGRRRRARCRSPAACCSSPPTTATPTTCSSDDGSPNTAHSLNPVPCIVTVDGLQLRDGGILADVAPTILAAARASSSRPAMTGGSLIAG